MSLHVRIARVAALVGAMCVVASCGGGGSGSVPTNPNQLSESTCPLVYTAKPMAAQGTGTDPLLAGQWHLDNTGQSGGTPGEDIRAFSAWQTARGQGVRVAVVDSAVEVVHEDLEPNVVPGGSYSYRPGTQFGSAYPLPCESSDIHGTAVAGIVAAKGNNAIGVSGVAPDASLVGLNPLATNLDADIAHALTYQNDLNAIYHNSWGSPDGGALYPSDSSFTNAIEQGLTQGRGGLGSIFVFPAGNGGFVNDNSNFDGYVNKRGLITVCAVDDTGVRPWYGEYGANVLLCGPSSNTRSAIHTTTIKDGYTTGFTGTSAAAPMVSGTVALMLQANPSLTWRDVPLILASTARQNAPLDAGWTQNFGLHHHPMYGFGTVDAQAAVAAAATWHSVGGSAEQKFCDAGLRTPNLPVPDNDPNNPAVDTVTVSGCPIQAIEFIEVRFTAQHSYSGDLHIELSSPNGLVSTLANERVCVDNPASATPQAIACGNYNDWPFGSVRHMNEPADGAWTLRVSDRQPQDSNGVFQSWHLRIWGR